MRKRTVFTLLAVFVALLALAVAVYLRQKAPPEAARLLPESDAIVYFDLKPLRATTHFDRTQVRHAPAYQQFIDATGIVPERDLDEAAFALHAMADPHGPNGSVAFSEVLTGRFDAGRLESYLAAQASTKESYAGHTIYNVPSENRTVRVTILAYDTLAASNMPTPEQIHSMLDRERAAASPFAGSSLLNARYGDVPAFSSAWAIGHVGLPFLQDGRITVMGLQLPLPAETTLVASVRYAAGLRLRIDQLTAADPEAAQSTASLNALLAMFRTVTLAQQPVPRTPEDAAMRSFVDSIHIEQHHERVTLTATLPTDALKHLAAEP